MSLDLFIRKIDRYLSKSEGQALVVDVQNYSDWSELITHYNVGTNQLIPAFKYCNKDELPRMDAIFEEAKTATGTVFITGVSSFLKLQGEQELEKTLRQMLSMSVTGHVVFITFQCKRYLSFNDPRMSRRIVIIDGVEQKTPEIIMTSPSLSKGYSIDKSFSFAFFIIISSLSSKFDRK